MNETVVIRDLAADDRQTWEPLWRGYHDSYNGSVATPVTDLTFSRFLDPVEPMFAIVAARSDTLVGFAHCILHRSTSRLSHYCYLQDIFVAPNARQAA